MNWCEALGTVLANEEVIDGKSERGDHPVVRVPMRQWMLKITAYADRLLEVPKKSPALLIISLNTLPHASHIPSTAKNLATAPHPQPPPGQRDA